LLSMIGYIYSYGLSLAGHSIVTRVLRLHWHRVLHKELDAQKLCAFLGFRPIDIVRKTLANTTQMARLIIRYPFRKHVKACFPFLNTRRINEGISTDRLYANCTDSGFGYTSAHVFYGMKMTNIQVYGY
jgi:hypothetical protein